MEDYKPMATPMITNMKKVTASNSKLVDPTMYMQLIGSLMYLVNTRPDICFVVNNLSQLMVEPRQEHWAAAKHVLEYLMGTVDYGIRYLEDGEVKMQGYSNSDWVGSATGRKSTSRCFFSLGLGMISWFSAGSRLQWHLTQQRQNRWKPTLLLVRPFGFALLVGLFD
jgi:hypothetical protein